MYNLLTFFSYFCSDWLILCLSLSALFYKSFSLFSILQLRDDDEHNGFDVEFGSEFGMALCLVMIL